MRQTVASGPTLVVVVVGGNYQVVGAFEEGKVGESKLGAQNQLVNKLNLGK